MDESQDLLALLLTGKFCFRTEEGLRCSEPRNSSYSIRMHISGLELTATDLVARLASDRLFSCQFPVSWNGWFLAQTESSL